MIYQSNQLFRQHIMQTCTTASVVKRKMEIRRLYKISKAKPLEVTILEEEKMRMSAPTLSKDDPETRD